MSFGCTEELGYDSTITRVAVPLKDFWIPLDSRTESDIQKDIFQRIEANDPAARENPSLYKQYFMDIHACEVVICTDKTEDAIASLSDSYRMYDVKRRPSTSAASRRSTSILPNTADPVGGNLSGPSQQHRSQRLYTGRKHIWVLFSEVGIPLDKVQNQKLLFTGLLHAFRGLRYLYIASYVHRDISGKISDLEYAKVLLSDGLKSDSKTRTLIFMAAVVQHKQYLFETMQADDYATLDLEFDSMFSAQRDVAVAHPTPFLHNFYHDAESLWWIGVRSLFTAEPSTTERDQDARRLQEEHFNTLFSHYAEGSQARLGFLKYPEEYATVTLCLPNEFRDVTVALKAIRMVLNVVYTFSEAQEHYPQYDHFANLFKQRYFEEALNKAAMGAITDVQPFQLEDRPTHEGAEDAIDWAPDGLEENYADYDPPEDDADDSGEYVSPRGTATKKSIDEVDEGESSNEGRAPKLRRTGMHSDITAIWQPGDARSRSTRSNRKKA
ncbi:hypothetical protein DFS33DRAFT_1452373 [Desarmillaria ectypa]|nr:hypothetical protein DFS33DRAFT_1452373 [Desarmillaria ectypa]